MPFPVSSCSFLCVWRQNNYRTNFIFFSLVFFSFTITNYRANLTEEFSVVDAATVTNVVERCLLGFAVRHSRSHPMTTTRTPPTATLIDLRRVPVLPMNGKGLQWNAKWISVDISRWTLEERSCNHYIACNKFHEKRGHPTQSTESERKHSFLFRGMTKPAE